MYMAHFIGTNKTRHRTLSRRRQDRTGQDRTGQDRTGQDRTGQDRTGQGKARQDKARQGKARKEETITTRFIIYKVHYIVMLIIRKVSITWCDLRN
jgi:hypothetical protein